MTKEFVDGKHDEMWKTASFMTAPAYGDDLVRHPAGVCPGGMADCANLFGGDLASTEKIQEFITHVRQGYAGFQSMITECADLYAYAAGMSQAELKSVVIDRETDTGLPNEEPRFQSPATP